MIEHPVPNEISEKQKKNLKSRIIVAMVLVVTCVPSFFLGGWFFFVLLAATMVIAIHEMLHATGKKFPLVIKIMTYIITMAFVYWFIIKYNLSAFVESRHNGMEYVFSLEQYFDTIDISLIGVAAAIGFYFLMAIVFKDFSFVDAFYFIVFTILLGIGFQAFFFCRYYPFYLIGYSGLDISKGFSMLGMQGDKLTSSAIFKYLLSSFLLFYVLLGTMMNDIFAYFVGILFGKHKMNPRISPNKTWEGFFGGWFFGFILSFAFGLILALCDLPLTPTLSKDYWYWILLISILLPLLGDLGDLSFSMIKRHFGIKDYGNILRGHGGVIDRIGSCMFGAIGTWIILVFITNGWNLLA